jgi:ABC-type transport system substrate-binding protein
VTSARSRALAAVVVAATVATACGGGGAGSSKPRHGGVLRIGVQRPATLDPAQASLPSDLLVAQQLFSTLTTYDPRTLSVRPGLAASWKSTPDQKHWDFMLRPNLKFSNGHGLFALDVKYTLERIAKKGSTSPVAVQLELVSGFKAFNHDGTADHLTGITAPAPDDVHIDLDQPLSSLPEVLGNPAFGIVLKVAVEAKTPVFAEDPVTSGPFMLASRTPDVLRLVRAPGATTYVDGVDVHLEKDATTSYQAFRDGKLDWSLVPAEKVDEVAARKNGRAGFAPYVAELFYGFNLKNPKYADPRFREAIVHAIDRAAITKAVYQGTVRTDDGLVADGVPGHQSDACGDTCNYDVARAKSLLKDVFGTKPVPTVKIDFDDDPTQQKIARAMQANLRDAGIPTDLRPHSYADYLNFAISGQQEIFRLGWIGAYPTPDAFLTPLFETGLPDNVTGFSNADVDALLKAGRSEVDTGKRIADYQHAERAVMRAVPVIPIAQFETHSIIASRVRGLVLSAFGTFDASNVWLTDASRT